MNTKHLNRATLVISLLGVKIGDSQMISQAGDGYGNVWYKLVYIMMYGWVVWVNNKASAVFGLGLGWVKK